MYSTVGWKTERCRVKRSRACYTYGILVYSEWVTSVETEMIVVTSCSCSHPTIEILAYLYAVCAIYAHLVLVRYIYLLFFAFFILFVRVTTFVNGIVLTRQVVEEVPLRNMAARLGIGRGKLQGLQKDASVFVGMVVCFCRHLQWHELANVLFSFQVRM